LSAARRSRWPTSGKGLLPAGAGQHAKVVLDLPGVTVTVPSPRCLLALKVQAARIDRDQDDMRFLAREAGAKTADDVLQRAGPGLTPACRGLCAGLNR
jgi:hypothetical protein